MNRWAHWLSRPLFTSRRPIAARRGSLRAQLILWNSIALILLLGALGVVTRLTVRSFLVGAIDADLEARTRNSPPPPPHGGPEGDHGPPHGGPPGEGSSFSGLFVGEGDSGRRGKSRGEAGQAHAVENSREDGGPRQDPLRLGPDFRREALRAGDRPGRHGMARLSIRDYFLPHHFDKDGKSLFPDDTRPLWDKRAFAAAKQGHTTYTNVVYDDEPLRVYTRPARLHNGTWGVVQTAYSLAGTNLALEGLDHALLALLPFGLIGAGVSGALLTDRVLRRVRRLTQSAAGMSAQRLDQRLPETGRDEFSELAHTFNGMLDGLELAFRQQERTLEQQRRFTADASHELKTPLTIIKGTASRVLAAPPGESDSQQAMQEINRAANNMSHLVQDLLLLARSDAGQLGRGRIEVLLREILEQSVSRVARPDSAPIALRIEDETLIVSANEDELTRLFANLLDNATRYTRPEGCVKIMARRETSQAIVIITDSGAGIAPEHLAHLGERFYRVESARTRDEGGTGLGLSIAKGIVEAHGGAMTFASTVGVGTTVTVRLPAVAV